MYQQQLPLLHVGGVSGVVVVEDYNAKETHCV